MEYVIIDMLIEVLMYVVDKGLIWLIVGLLVFVIVVFLIMLVVVLFIFDQNDYVKVSVFKYECMVLIEGLKVVLIGGFNFVFGIESDVIESVIGCVIVNMGMNGYFGLCFMLWEVCLKFLVGDIVVIVFEWDNFGKFVDGLGKDLFVVVKLNFYVW